MKKILLSSILLFGIGVISMAQEKRTTAATVKEVKAVEKTKAEVMAEKASAAKTTTVVNSSLNHTPVYVSKREAMKAAAAQKN